MKLSHIAFVIYWSLLGGQAALAASPLKLGPVPAPITIDDEEFRTELTLEGSLESTSATLNFDGAIRVGMDLAELNAHLLRMARNRLPYQTDGLCVLTIQQLEAGVADAQLTGVARAALARGQCPTMQSERSDGLSADVSVLFASDSKSVGQLRFRQSKNATLKLPFGIATAVRIFTGVDPVVALNKLIDEGLSGVKACVEFKAKTKSPGPACQNMIDKPGVTAAFKGANFTLEKGKIWLNVKLDGRVEPTLLTPLLADAVKQQNRTFKLLKP